MEVANQCYIHAVGSGETLHPSLIATKPLSQSYNSSSLAFLPDWTDENEKPVIYLSLLAGATPKLPVGGGAGGKWYYNGTELQWSGNNCTNFTYQSGGSTVPSFIRTTYNIGTEDDRVDSPALKINGNLATGGNIDIDKIRWVGQGELDGVNHDIDLTLPVRLAEWSGSGYFGQILFSNGVSVIKTANGTVTATARLYKDTLLAQSEYRCIWKLNGNIIATDVYNLTIGQAQVTDYAILECEYYAYSDTSHEHLLTVAAEGIDDQQDPEYLYRNHEIYKNNAWGNEEIRGAKADIRKDQKVRFVAWMGTETNEAVDDTWTLSVKFSGLPGTPLNNAHIASLSGLTATNGFYPMTKDNTSNKWRTPEVTFAEASAQGMNISLFIKASR